MGLQASFRSAEKDAYRLTAQMEISPRKRDCSEDQRLAGRKMDPPNHPSGSRV